MVLTPRRRLLPWLAVVVAAAGACAGDDGEPSASTIAPVVTAPAVTALDEGVLVGVVLAPDGLEADVADGVVEAVESMGRVLGEPVGVAVVEADDPAAAAAGVGALAEVDARLLVVGCAPEVFVAAAERAAIHDLVVVSPCAGSVAGLTDRARAITVSLGLDPVAEGRLLAEQAVAAGARDLVVVAQTDRTDLVAACASAVGHHRELGGSVVAEVELASSPEAVPALAADLSRFSTADLVVVCAERTRAVDLVQEARSLGSLLPLLVSSSGSGLDERGVTVFDLHGSAAGPPALGRAAVDLWLTAVEAAGSFASVDAIAELESVDVLRLDIGAVRLGTAHLDGDRPVTARSVDGSGTVRTEVRRPGEFTPLPSADNPFTGPPTTLPPTTLPPTTLPEG